MRKEKHLSESEILELLSQKPNNALRQTDHLANCPSCQNELSSLYKTARALKTVKFSREERLRMLTEGVSSDLSQRRTLVRARIPAIAAALVLLTFGIYFYTSFFIFGITAPNSRVIGSAVSFGNLHDEPRMYVQAQNFSVIGSHSNQEATSRSIVSSVVQKGEVQDNGQSQQDSLSVSSNHVFITTSSSF
ncbi:MAG: hypothetical protein PHD88_00040 [Firmicutes bacterium]|nr:hypothetical protein [Bacillota bacterium]MDD4263901.1 hypothetical protein [Bacillota bacterium]MDD4692784.1 hypothetical protein [Bacillota bacterium]